MNCSPTIRVRFSRIICRSVGRVQLHLCRRYRDAAERRLHSESQSHRRVSGRRARSDRPRPAEAPAYATRVATSRFSWPGEPRDKAKAEVAVQIAQRWIRRLVPARDTVRHKNRPNLRVTEVRSSSNGYRSPAASRARPQMCAAQLADETSDRSMASFSCPPRPHLVSHSRNVPNACEGHSAIQGRRQDAAKKEKTRGRVREGTTTISPRGLAARVLCARQ